MQQRCFGCNKDNVPLFRERNKGRIFCGVSCQQVGASWWLDFKRLNKTKIRVLKGDDNREEEIEIEMAPRAIWNLIVESGMKEEQIVADFLDYDNYEDVFAEPVEKLGLRGPQIYRTNVERHNASLITMLTWLDENYRFRSGIDAWHFFHNMIIHMIAHPNLNDITASIFNHLLTLKNYHPAFEELRQACLQRNAVVVARMLESGRFDSTQDHTRLIVEICKLGYAEIAELLLRDTRDVPLTLFHDAIKIASENGHAEVVALLLRDKRVIPLAVSNYAIRKAAEQGHAEVVRVLLQDERVDPSEDHQNYNYAVQTASLHGHAEVVRVLLEDERVDPSADFSYAIRIASENGHAEVVRMLMQDEHVDPSAWNNYAIRWASRNGHAKVVRMLLQDERVDPSAEDNEPIRWASKNGHAKVVRMLLQDERVDPSAGDNNAIQWASRDGYADIVRMLLQDERVDPSVRDNVAIRLGSQYGHVEVVRVLLQDERVDPSAKNNYAIQWASQNGQAEVVRILLQDERVNPSTQDNYAIRKASENGHAKVVAILLRDRRVLRAMTPEVFERLRQENPAMKDEIDAAQVSWARAVEQEHDQEEEEGGLKRVKLGKKLFMI